MSKKMPVLLTFDVDGEMIWRCRDPENANRPVTLSLGEYGIKCGLPRILKMMDKYDIPATYFVPGFIAEKYPDIVPRLNNGKNTIGNHSYSHTYPDKFPSIQDEEDDYMKAQKILTDQLGYEPKGYRSPAWEYSTGTLDILEKMGFEYASNMMGSDRIEYLEFFGRQSKIVELPIHWILDDAAFWLYSVRIPGKAMQPLDSVLDCWIREFDGLYEDFIAEEAEGIDSDIAFVLTCHPQVIGRPSRMTVLERLIQHIRSKGNVEFVNMEDAVKRFREKYEK